MKKPTAKEQKQKIKQLQMERIIKALEQGATMTLAAEHGNIGRSTLYKWIKMGNDARAKEPYKTFANDVRRAESQSALQALSTINTAIADGDVKAAMWLLHRRHNYKTDATHSIEEIPTESTAQTPAQEDYRTMLQTQIAELKTSMNKAKDSGSWQAYAALQRQMVTLMQEIRALDAEEGAIDAHERMTDEQLLAEIVNTIIALPPMLRQRVQSDLHSLVGSNVVVLKKV